MINVPEKCLRCKNNCLPLAQIQSSCGKSFICVGANDGSARKVEQDKYTLCWKNDEIDEMGDWDERDLTDTLSVIAQALSLIENIKVNEGRDIDIFKCLKKLDEE